MSISNNSQLISSIPAYQRIQGDVVVQNLMIRSLSSGSAGGISGRLVSPGYASLAIVVTVCNIVGYTILLPGARLVSAILTIKFTGLQTTVANDLNQAKDRVIFAAVITQCIFLHLFLPGRFSFHLPQQQAVVPYGPPPAPSASNFRQLQLTPEAAEWFRHRGIDPLAGPILVDPRVFQRNLPPLALLAPSQSNEEVVVIPEAALPSEEELGPLIEELAPPAPLQEDLSMSGSFVIVESPTVDEMREMLLKVGQDPDAIRSHKVSAFDKYFGRHQHPAKDLKYTHILLQMLSKCVGKTNWQLIGILEDMSKFPDVRDQYQALVFGLREIGDPGLSYVRFAEVELYSYCRSLVLLVCKKIPNNLTLDDFADVFLKLNEKLDKVPPHIGVSVMDRAFRKLSGAINILFDPLAGSNAPYKRATLRLKNGRTVRLLRHGDPITQTDFKGIPLRFIEWLLKKIQSSLGSLGEFFLSIAKFLQSFRENHSSAVITADYIQFIEEAGRRGENILHGVLESAEDRIVGDEADRVRARMQLQRYKNFFPIAFPLDGEFFEKHTNQPFEALQKKVIEHILFPEQLSKDPEFMEQLIPDICDEVRAIFFQGHVNVASLEDQQTYLMLVYVHITLALIDRLNISILELFCKDDIDRGNMLKAILEIYFLLLAGKENDSQTLEKVMVNILAAPLIVKKQGVIKSRKNFLKYVLEAFKRLSPADKEGLRKLWSSRGIEPQDYEVVEVPFQGVYPTGATARTREEYDTFLRMNAAKEEFSTLPPFPGNLVDSLASGQAFRTNGGLDADKIKHQVEKDFNRYPTYVGRSQEPVKTYEEAFAYLIQNNLSPEEAQKVLCCFQQGLSADVFGLIGKIVNNPSLHLMVCHDDAQGDQSFERMCVLDAKDGIASLQFIFLSKVINFDTREVLGKFGASVIISDHRTGANKAIWFVRE